MSLYLLLVEPTFYCTIRHEVGLPISPNYEAVAIVKWRVCTIVQTKYNSQFEIDDLTRSFFPWFLQQIQPNSIVIALAPAFRKKRESDRLLPVRGQNILYNEDEQTNVSHNRHQSARFPSC